MDIKDLEHILAIVKGSDITRFELEHDGTKLKLARNGEGVMRVGTDLVRSAPMHSDSGEIRNEIPDNLVKVDSPIVGTFYRKPSPDAEPFVNEGSQVKKGDTLCIIEAMKLMNELEAPCSGRIEKILLSDGRVVEYGELLFLIKPDA